MKPGNNNRRPRGRGPRKPHGHGMGSGKPQGFDGGGGEYRVRGNAHQILERYLQLARDAGAAGDRVAAENYLQHADHYYRVLAAHQEGQRPRIGGREISVAEVNVQNVSQGLSAALSTGAGNVAPTAGGLGNEGHDGAGGQAPDNAQHANRPHEFNRNPMPTHDRQPGPHQAQPMREGYAQGNVHSAHPSSEAPHAMAEAPKPYVPVQPQPPTGDDQPDYPEELLQPAGAPTLAVETEGAGAPEAAEENQRPRPRHRLRGPGRRVRGAEDGAPGGGTNEPDQK